MPGALTPTEVAAAWQGGADCVKLFPAEIVGIPYLKALRAPLPDVPIMPTGGVDVDNAAEWLRAGAVALGVGSQLVRKDALASGKYELITETARKFLAAIAAAGW
jgi:2-dehydro-3-deoxyphosphogluconate aldolase/(4S)-4-hydroxy-2-oxoglutarate aldolase